MLESWTAIGDWQAEALNYLIEKEDYEIIFSHYHNVDLEGRNMAMGSKAFFDL